MIVSWAYSIFWNRSMCAFLFKQELPQSLSGVGILWKASCQADNGEWLCSLNW